MTESRSTRSCALRKQFETASSRNTADNRRDRMNSKLIAVLAVIAIAVSGVTLAMSDSTEAVGNGSAEHPYELGHVFVDKTKNGTEANAITSVLKFNESAYDYYAGYDFSFWAASTAYNTNSCTQFYTTKNTEEIDAGTDEYLNISATGSDGKYILKIWADDNTTTGEKDLVIKLQVTVHLVSGDTESESSIVLDPIYYHIDVTVTNDQTLSISNELLIFTQNIQGEQNVIFNDSISLANTEWYAVGLPAGLNISVKEDKLVIHGMPVNTTVAESNGYVSVKIVGRDSNGTEYTGTVNIKVNAENVVSVVLKDGSNALKGYNDNNYVTNSSNPDITLEITGVGSANVTVINSTGVRGNAVANEGTASNFVSYKIPTDGAGTYTIEVDIGSDVQELILHIVPNTTGAGAGFVVVGTGA